MANASPGATRTPWPLMALLVASIVVPALLFGLAAWSNHAQQVRDAELRAEKTAAILHEHLLKVFETDELVIDRIDERIHGLSWDRIRGSRELHDYLATVDDAYAQIDALLLVDPAGRIALASNAFPLPPAIDVSDRDYFTALAAADLGTFVDRPTTGRVNGDPVFAVARRRIDPGKGFDGLIVVSVSQYYLAGFYRTLTSDKDESISVVRADGVVLVRNPPLAGAASLSPDSPLMQRIARTDGGEFDAVSPLDGVRRIVSYRRIGRYPVFVVYGLGLDGALRDWYGNLRTYGAFAALCSLGLVGFSTVALRRARREQRAVLRSLQAAQSLQEEIERRRAAETALRESDAYHRAFYNRTPVLLHSVDSDGRLISVSDYWLEFMGYRRDEVIGRPITDFMTTSAARYRLRIVYPRIAETGGVRDIEYEYVKKSGEIVQALVSTRIERDEAGHYLRSFTVVTDITARKQAEEALRRSEESFRYLYQKTPVMLHSIDRDGRLLNVSDYWLRQLGYARDEVIGRSFGDFLTESSRRHAEEVGRPALLRDGMSRGVLYEVLRKDGSTMNVLINAVAQRDADGGFVRSLTVSFDVTEWMHAEEKLRQAQKMEAVGQLTGGVAHDFNNLLTAVLGNLQLARRRLGDPAALERLIGNAARAAERGAALTQQLLAFSRKQHLKRSAVDIDRLLARMSELLQRSIGPLVDVDTRLVPELWPALVDANQLELALLNLAINARDAMPQGGRLEIATANSAAGDPKRPADLPPGNYVRIDVTDNGTGMSEEVLTKAFEPFFTTKEPGKGSGLGLSQVYGFARQSGGTVRIDSRIGRGTSVQIFLPRAVGDDEAAEATPPSAAVEHGGGRRLLLVDDDADVRDVAAAALRSAGYDVREAKSGWEALEALDRGDAVDLLIADVAMPGLTGIALVAEARQRRPSLPALLITGYADAALDDTNEPLLRKPFSLTELTEKVQTMFAGPPGPAAAEVVPLHTSTRRPK